MIMSQIHIPEQMSAAFLHSYTGVMALRVEQCPVPQPGPNEVLIKVAASPVNPSDLAFLEGSYALQKPTPVVPGIEGAGTVVAVGSGLMGRYLAGKRVACISGKQDGVWAEYMVTTANYSFPLDDTVDLEQGSMSVANPLTAVAFLEIARNGGHKTIVNTAAASALGQMLNRLGQQEGVQVINVVRREAQVAILKQQGAAVVLNSSDPDFEKHLHDACHQHNAHLAFDAVAGTTTLQLLEAMPPRSKVTLYGGLSLAAAQALPGHLIFEGKSIDGFWLTSWFAGRNFLRNLALWKRAQKLMATALRTDIRARYPLAEVQQAVQDYQNQMTGGKVLIIP
jgi:NADPH:quinone reductase